MIFRILSVSIFSLFCFTPYFSYAASPVCIQKIQYAQNQNTGECQAFSTPCDVPSGWASVDECSLTQSSQKITPPKFQIQKFSSCQDMESRLVDILKRYQSDYWYPSPLYARAGSTMDTVNALKEKAGSLPSPVASIGGETTANLPVSHTNTQVFGVDEADSVKTDGTFLYTSSEVSHEVRILRASDLNLTQTIKLPEQFSGINLYVSRGRLIIVGNKYVSNGFNWGYRWYAPEVKSLLAVYNISNPSKPFLERYSQIDGDYRESRLIGDTLYLISSNPLRMPPVYTMRYAKESQGFLSAITAIDKDFSLKNVAPEIRESIRNNNTGRYIQSIRSSVANCQDVTFLLPDNTTQEGHEFTPSFVSLSSINIADSTARMKSQLLFGDVSQIHMSQTSLYVVSSVTSRDSSIRCSDMSRCSSPLSYTSHTIVHKYALSFGGLAYQYSAMIDGNPLNQYSLDEDAKGNFRIVTQKFQWRSTGGNENTTELYVISPIGKVIGSLKNLASGENFQSSRFIGDRLYLVTFQQIDPLFVIDISTPTAPKTLGELKIPGYSTYLHPYDDSRLIGIGYDTKSNQWGLQNAGLKIDLYNVADVKNPKQEATLTLGDQGSYSEVLSQPRTFVWYKEKNLLLLPATLMKSAHDPRDAYRYQSVFQGVVGILIQPNSITEKFRVTHISPDPSIEKRWKEECAGYSSSACVSGDSGYCVVSLPNYCIPGSTLETYLVSNFWNYQGDFVNRVLYIGNAFYSLAENGVRSWKFSDTTTPTAQVSFSGNLIPPLPSLSFMKR